ncbi:MAG: excisionase family DNA-binding protein [Deltaproteobacteria bacterium]|nr:excisionase family DNA-binding protein [Deltaproteobacteria bacterium]
MKPEVIASALTDLLDLPSRLSNVEAALRRLEQNVGALAERLPPPYKSPAEAAIQLGCSVPTIRRRIKDGTLRAVRIGRSWRVDTTSLVPPSEEQITALAFTARTGSGK